MNKNIVKMTKRMVMGLLPFYLFTLLLSITGCKSNDDIVFEHERQQFETRADRILLEYIAPFGTTADEEIYIIGPFNGNSLDPDADGKYQVPVLDEAYKLTKAEKSNAKWGIYLDPAAFQNGKTLADGFRFYSVKQGNEAQLGDKAALAVHNNNPSVGTFTNIWGQRWESYYWGADGPEIEHDGFVVYVIDETGWDAITLYQWGDVNNLNGDWPGVAPTGVQTINGQQYKYWDMGEANTGLNQNLIFNNNGAGIQLADFAYTIDHDVYLEVTDAGVTEIDPYNYGGGGGGDTPEPQPQPTGDKVIIAVKNSVGYGDPHLYVWGDSEACGGWPGAAPVKVTDNGWCLFELPANGTFNLILNDNGSPQTDGPEVFTAGSHFFDVNAGWEESPNTVTIQNNAGYSDPRLYAWGSGEIYGGWRGITPTSNADGKLVFPLPNDGGEYNLILNSGDGNQQDIATVIANKSYTFTAD